jgi:hypothetical protein
MGMFSRRLFASQEASGCVDDQAQERVPHELREAQHGSPALLEFLKQRQLIAPDESTTIERCRKRVEESGLVSIMMETCGSINRMVGRTIIDVHSFLPPEPILCCFIFVEEGTEYFMRLELRGEIPTLLFVERKWRDTVANDFVRWAHRLAEIEPVTMNVKLVHEFDNLRVSAEQVREWFMYLVSGMDRSHTPSF